MSEWGFTDVSGDSAVHRCDARVKIALLVVFTVGIFFVRSWWGMGACAGAVVACMAVARIPVRKMAAALAPVAFLAAFAVVFAIANAPDAAGVSAGLLTGVRMVVLVAGSFIVCFTTSPTALLEGFAKLIGPLRAVRVPVDDVAFTLSLALRFIPVLGGEFVQVRNAQRARGGDMAGMSFRRKLEVLGAAFAAVFVGMFRHADALAQAMDSRCYGTAERRTTLGACNDDERRA